MRCDICRQSLNGTARSSQSVFRVRRGTLLKLDRDAALLWVHSVSRAINPRLNYYQGQAPHSGAARHPTARREV
jgi:hypothetical protein